MSSATIQKVLSPARRIPKMREAAVHTSVADKSARPFYERLYRPPPSKTRLRAAAVAPKQDKPSPEERMTTSPRTTSKAGHPNPTSVTLVAHARTDYAHHEFEKTRIPKPTTAAVKKAYARRTSTTLHMMGIGEDEAPEYHEANVAEDSEKSDEMDIISFVGKAEVGADNEYTDVYFPTFDPNEPWDLEHSGLSQDEKTSLMFNDKSFDEDVDPDAQTSGFNIFERRIVSGKRVGMGLRIAQVPRYVGGDFGIQRRRPLPPPKVRDIQENQVHAYYNPPRALTTCKLPYLVWPQNKPTTAVDEEKSTTVPDPTLSSSRRPATAKKEPTTEKKEPTSISALGRKGSKPMRSDLTVNSEPSRRTAAPRPKSRFEPRLALNPIAVPNKKPITTSKAKDCQTKIEKPTSKSGARESRRAKPKLKSAMRQPGSKPTDNHVKILDGPTNPRFYSRKDTVKQSAIALSETAPFHWEPLNDLPHSQPSSEGGGVAHIFENASLEAVTLKPSFLNRFASVQRYEKRRYERMLLRRQHPGLGQLEYGNADFKIDLKASELVMSHEIGMRLELSAIGKKGRMPQVPDAEPVLVFGAFEEPFEPALIPEKGVKAYKKPLPWPATERRLEQFAETHLMQLQTADLEH